MEDIEVVHQKVRAAKKLLAEAQAMYEPIYKATICQIQEAYAAGDYDLSDELHDKLWNGPVMGMYRLAPNPYTGEFEGWYSSFEGYEGFGTDLDITK